MHNNIVYNIVLDYLKVYLNPRIKSTGFEYENWAFNMSFDYSFQEDGDLYYSKNFDWNLYLKNNQSMMTPSEVNRIFFYELNELNLDIDNDIYQIISSMLLMFYLPYNGFNDENIFIHQKFLSLTQIALNSNDEKLNNLYRDIYIKNIFYNSFLSDLYKYIKFRDGILYFKKNPLRIFFNELSKIETSYIFNNVIKYCLSLVCFLENGIPRKYLSELMDDVFFTKSHYCYFEKENIKPYFYKKTVILLDEMYSCPTTNLGNAINKIFVLNFLIFNRNYMLHIEKYINKRNFDKIKSDILYLKKAYFRFSNRKLS